MTFSFVFAIEECCPISKMNHLVTLTVVLLIHSTRGQDEPPPIFPVPPPPIPPFLLDRSENITEVNASKVTDVMQNATSDIDINALSDVSITNETVNSTSNDVVNAKDGNTSFVETNNVSDNAIAVNQAENETLPADHFSSNISLNRIKEENESLSGVHADTNGAQLKELKSAETTSVNVSINSSDIISANITSVSETLGIQADDAATSPGMPEIQLSVNNDTNNITGAEVIMAEILSLTENLSRNDSEIIAPSTPQNQTEIHLVDSTTSSAPQFPVNLPPPPIPVQPSSKLEEKPGNATTELMEKIIHDTNNITEAEVIMAEILSLTENLSRNDSEIIAPSTPQNQTEIHLVDSTTSSAPQFPVNLPPPPIPVQPSSKLEEKPGNATIELMEKIIQELSNLTQNETNTKPQLLHDPLTSNRTTTGINQTDYIFTESELESTTLSMVLSDVLESREDVNKTIMPSEKNTTLEDIKDQQNLIPPAIVGTVNQTQPQADLTIDSVSKLKPVDEHVAIVDSISPNLLGTGTANISVQQTIPRPRQLNDSDVGESPFQETIRITDSTANGQQPEGSTPLSTIAITTPLVKMTQTPLLKKGTDAISVNLPPPPEHPPPIFSGNQRPPIYTESFPDTGFFQNPNIQVVPITHSTTTEATLPPINVPSFVKQHSIAADKSTSKSNENQVGAPVYEHDPRFMNTLELAAFALQQSQKRLNPLFGNARTNVPSAGFKETTDKVTLSSTSILTTTTRTNIFTAIQSPLKQEVPFVAPNERFSLPRTPDVNKIPVPKASLAVPTTAQPSIPLQHDSNQIPEFLRVLQEQQHAATKAPTSTISVIDNKKFFNTKELLMLYGIGVHHQTQQGVFLKSTTTSRPFIVTTTTEATNASKFFNAHYLLSHIGVDIYPVETKSLSQNIISGQNRNTSEIIYSVESTASQHSGETPGLKSDAQGIKILMANAFDTKPSTPLPELVLKVVNERARQTEISELIPFLKNAVETRASTPLPVLVSALLNQKTRQMETRPLSIYEQLPQHSFLVDPPRQDAKPNLNTFVNDQSWQQNNNNHLKSQMSFIDPKHQSDNKQQQLQQQQQIIFMDDKPSQQNINAAINRQTDPMTSKFLLQPRDHVFGETAIQVQSNEHVRMLKERFNRKWSQLNSESIQTQPIVNVQIETPPASVEVQANPTSMNTKNLFSVIFNRGQKSLEYMDINHITNNSALSAQSQKEPSVNDEFQRQKQALLEQQSKMEQAQRLEQQRLLEIQQRQDHEHLLEVLRKQEHEKRQRLMDVQKREEQQQEKLMMEDRIRNERRRVALELDQIPREADLSPPFSLALLTGKSEVKSDSNIVRSEYRHDYSPAGALSSIEIFKAPGFHRRQNPNIIPTPLTTTLATTASTIMDHWHARFNQRDLHEHLGVPYQIDLSRKTHAQSNQNQPTEVIDKITVSPVILQFTTQYASTTTSTTPATSVTRAPTTTTVPPILQTADPNPPPIFDTKVQFTFMPMPNIEKSTKPTVSKASANGSTPDEILPVNFDKRCQGCVFVNDRCLLPDRVHCHQYVECVRQGQTVRAFNRECALGSFFDRKTYICVDPKNADCPTDRCREPGTKWYTIHGHCKHYWSCGLREGGAPYAQSSCCPDMGGFVDDVGCVENKNCTDSCEKPIQMEGPAGCLLRKTDKPSVYFDGNANIDRPCAPGTIFNERACTCVQDVAIERSPNKPGAGTCMPLLAVTFTGNQVADDSHQKQHIGVDGVSSSVEGHGIFTGNSRLVLWRYANHMLPLVFAIRFSFLSQNTEPRFQTLISNCDDKTSREPSLEISIDTQYQEVIFKVDTYEGVAKRFKIMYNKTKWNEVALIYDGERIVGSVDRRARNMLGGGGIETRPQPIGIGMCSNSNGFKGLIDDVNIYEDCIPDEMFGIFMSVLE